MKILVLAAHPDDEVLGCGGTLYKLSRKKENKIFIAFAADGVGGRYPSSENNHRLEVEKRRQESQKITSLLRAKIINIEDKNYYQFKDQRLIMEDFNSIVGWANNSIKKVRPEIIFTHFEGDINIDHRILTEAVAVATRPSKFNFIKKIYSFEINTEDTNQGPILGLKIFNPNIFERINLDNKLRQFGQYKSEHWISWREDITILAKFRGMNSGYDFAEAFMLVRERND